MSFSNIEVISQDTSNNLLWEIVKKLGGVTTTPTPGGTTISFGSNTPPQISILEPKPHYFNNVAIIIENQPTIENFALQDYPIAGVFGKGKCIVYTGSQNFDAVTLKLTGIVSYKTNRTADNSNISCIYEAIKLQGTNIFYFTKLSRPLTGTATFTYLENTPYTLKTSNITSLSSVNPLTQINNHLISIVANKPFIPLSFYKQTDLAISIENGYYPTQGDGFIRNFELNNNSFLKSSVPFGHYINVSRKGLIVDQSALNIDTNIYLEPYTYILEIDDSDVVNCQLQRHYVNTLYQNINKYEGLENLWINTIQLPI